MLRTSQYISICLEIYQRVSVFIMHIDLVLYVYMYVHVDLYSINGQLGGHHEACLRYGLPFAQMLFVAGAKHAPAL